MRRLARKGGVAGLEVKTKRLEPGQEVEEVEGPLGVEEVDGPLGVEEVDKRKVKRISVTGLAGRERVNVSDFGGRMMKPKRLFSPASLDLEEWSTEGGGGPVEESLGLLRELVQEEEQGRWRPGHPALDAALVGEAWWAGLEEGEVVGEAAQRSSELVQEEETTARSSRSTSGTGAGGTIETLARGGLGAEEGVVEGKRERLQSGFMEEMEASSEDWDGCRGGYEEEKEDLLELTMEGATNEVSEVTLEVKERTTEEEEIDTNVNKELEPAQGEAPVKLAVPSNETLGELELKTFQRDTARGLECEQCGMVFSSAFGLRIHMIKHIKAKTKRVEITQLQCKKCERRFSSMRGLKIHMAMHSRQHTRGAERGDGASVEAEGSKDALDEEGFQFWLSMVNGEEEGKGEKGSDEEWLPMMQHSKARRTRDKVSHEAEFVCQACDRKCCTWRGLKIHMAVHTKESMELKKK